MKKLLVLTLILTGSLQLFSQYQIVENFDGPALDTRLWFWRIPWFDHYGFGDQYEAEIREQNIGFEYDPDAGSNVVVLTYKNESPPTGNGFDYSVGQLFSVPEIWHGEIEMRAKVPDWGYGNYYSEYWYYGTCSEEIDIFEFINSSGNTAKATIHGPKGNCSCSVMYGLGPELYSTNSSSYHTYKLIWNNNVIELWFDGSYWTSLNSSSSITVYDDGNNSGCSQQTYHNVSADQLFPENPLNIIIAFRSHESVTPSPLPGEYKIDYIKIRQYGDCNNDDVYIQNKNIYWGAYNQSIYLAKNIFFAGNGTVSEIGNPDPNKPWEIGYCLAQASNSIHLNAGFHARSGSFFKAELVSCNKSMNSDVNTVNNPVMDVMKRNEINEEISESSETGNNFPEVNIMPNPSDGIVKIITNSNHTFNIEINDFLGQKLFTLNNVFSSQDVHLESLNKGSYYMKVYNDEFTVTKKLILK